MPADAPPTALAARLDGALGWGALAGVLAAVLGLGGDHPASALALALWLLPLLAVRLGFDLARPLDRRARALAPAALAVLAVLVWATLQATPGVAPTAWWHPAWAHVDAVGAIAVDPLAARLEVARLVGYVAAFWLVMRAAVERRRAHRFVVAVALVTAAHALYALLAHVTGLNPLVDRVGPTAGPLTGSFLNRNAYATYAVFGLLANLAVWLTRLERRGVAAGGRARLRAVVEALTAGGWLFLVGAGLCAVSIVLAQSRAGAAVAVVGVLVLVAASGRGPRPRPAAHAARLTGAGLVALVAVVGLNPRAALAPGDDVRWPVYAALIEAIGERPWLGQGLGGFTDGFRPHTPFATAALEWGSAHQGYLELAYELGLPAAALFYAALAVVVARIWRGARRRRRDTALPALALAATAAGGLHAGVDFSFAMPAVAGLLATLLGIGYAQSFSSRAARPNAAGADTGGKG